MKNRFLIGEVSEYLGVSRDTLRSVSYTHLDVYKRQAIDKTPKTQTIVMSFFLKIDISIKIVKNI